MKAKEIREKDDAKLTQELADLRTKTFTLRTQAVTQKVEDTAGLGKIRRDIARIETILNERRRSVAAKK